MDNFIEKYILLKLTQEKATTQKEQYPKNWIVKTSKE